MNRSNRQYITDDVLFEDTYVAPRRRLRPTTEDLEISMFERVAPDALDLRTPLYAGQDISERTRKLESRKARIKSAIQAMVTSAPSWDGFPASVTKEAAQSAKQFIACLPPNRRLPKIAAEGDGDVLLVWGGSEAECIVTVQDKLLHMVISPCSPNPIYVDAQPFLGEHIPVSILRYLKS